MEEEKIIESLDSHWYFCSVFNPPPSSCSHSWKVAPALLKDTHTRKGPTPTMPVPQQEQNQSTIAGVGTETIPKYDISVHGYISSEMEQRRANCKSSGESTLRRGWNPGKKEIVEFSGFIESGFDDGRYDSSMSEDNSSDTDERSKRRRSSNSCSTRKRRSSWMKEFGNVRGFMELGFPAEDIGLGTGLPMGRFDIPRGMYLHCKMPPFGDGIAMKEHLRSWAYAVACIVR